MSYFHCRRYTVPLRQSQACVQLSAVHGHGQDSRFDSLSLVSLRGTEMTQILYRIASACCPFRKTDAVLAMCSLADSCGTVAAHLKHVQCCYIGIPTLTVKSVTARCMHVMFAGIIESSCDCLMTNNVSSRLSFDSIWMHQETC